MKTVLIVEDDVFLSDMYQTKFTEAGYTVRLAQDGSLCLAELQGGFRPDVVLLDIVMPKMDGIEVLSALKRDDKLKEIPVVLLTNLWQESDVTRGMEMGAFAYLVKAHFTPSELVKKVEGILGELEARQKSL